MSIDALRQELSYDPETGVFRWLRSSAGRRVGEVAGSGRNEYRSIGIQGKKFQAHRLAFAYMTGAWPADFVDHVNGVRDDNRWANLRPATQSENSCNQRQAKRRDNSSGLLGVSRHGNAWKAQIGLNGKNTYLGSFATLELAHDAYLTAKRAMHDFCTI